MSVEGNVPVNTEKLVFYEQKKPRLIISSVDSNQGDVSKDVNKLKQIIPCDDDESHTAVLYCTDCKANLCQICSDSLHSRKRFSKHVMTKFSEKSEQLIYCPSHPEEIVKYVCKEFGCNGINKPMCELCHLHETHKGHKCENLDKEYKDLCDGLATCLIDIDKNLVVCKEHCDEYDRCISTYFCTDGSSIKNERDKIKKFFSDAETLALKKFDDFTNNRIETLKSLKNNYMSEIIELNNMTMVVRNIEKMRKMEVIKCGGNVKMFVNKLKKGIVNPTDLVPSTCFSVILPEIKSIEICSRLAVYHPLTFEKFITHQMRFPRRTEETAKGKLFEYNYEGVQLILDLKEEPTDATIELSSYKYVCLLSGDGETIKVELREHIRTKWWNRIVVLINSCDWYSNEPYVAEIKMIAETDKRVEVMVAGNHTNLLKILKF